MSIEQKGWLNGIWKSVMTLGVFVIIFQSAQGLQYMKDSTFTSPEERFKVVESSKEFRSHELNKDMHTERNEYVPKEEYDETINELTTALKRIEWKVDNLTRGAGP